MSIQKKSLISTLKTAKKANAAKGTVEVAPASGKLATRKLATHKLATHKLATRKLATRKLATRKLATSKF